MVERTIDFYNANAGDYAADGSVNPRLEGFLKRVRPGGTILELGAGSGQDARFMINAGFRVDATDASVELAAIAQQLIGQPVRHLRFQDLSARAEYDGVYASASLLHAHRNELNGIIARIQAALTDNGIAWASFKAGSVEGVDRFDRYYNYVSAEELESVWRTAANWKMVEIECWRGSGYDHQPTAWLGVTASR